ncbi:hypothetical protein ACP4OV_002165 [Aristida adscensionis]
MAAPAAASLSPISGARPLAGSTVSLGAWSHKKKRIPAMRVRCAADDEGGNITFTAFKLSLCANLQ